ncbi:MAG TPA: ATP-dependent helicase, partial [Corynebacterium sp.]|nr:ATP-dependent helicase [Corynebacterium sp.]
PPAEHKAYLHRAGRTARAGTSGTVVTLVMDEQRREVEGLMRKAGVDAPETRVTADSDVLTKITGARVPSGTPLAAPGQQQPQKRPRRNRPQGQGQGQARRSQSRRPRRSRRSS